MLNSNAHLSSTFLRSISGPNSPDSNLRSAVPRLFETPSGQSNEFQQCLDRLFAYRQKLYSELDTLECDDKYRRFYDDMTEAVNDAKLSVSGLDDVLKESRQLNDINKHLLPELISKEQHLKLYKLLRETVDHEEYFKVGCNNLKRDFKKQPIDSLILNVKNIRKRFAQFMACFNILLRGNVQETSPIYQHLYKVTEEWKSKLFDLAEEVFVWSFDFIKWPKIGVEATKADKVSDKHMTLFGELFRFLLEMQTGQFKVDGEDLVDNRIKSLDLYQQAEEMFFHVPLKLMTVPLSKRFNFHFLNPSSKLNNIENPEWYLCQVEQWITRNEDFLNDITDPILEEFFGTNCKSSKFQLTCHLLELVRTKLQHDSNQLADDKLFSLTLDEVIIFNKQINFLVPGIFEIMSTLNPVHVFFDDDDYFQRFLEMEKNRLNEFVDSIFESETSWNILYGSDFTEDNKFIICEAADKFSLLLQNLIERSTFIPSQEYRVRIIDLILDTMDDFRLRLSQLIYDYEEKWPFSKKFYAILNTFSYLIALINDWQSNTYFLQILHENNRDQTIFSSISQNFEHLIEEIFQRIENEIIADVTKDINQYKTLNWHSMSINPNQMTLTKEGSNLIYNISVKNSTIQKSISSSLFHTFLYDIAAKIQDLFFDHIIMEHFFNKDGAQQLGYDIRVGLFSIFSLYIKNTEYTFSKLSDALVVLNCSSSTCRNLQDRYRNDSEIEFKTALRNIGVYSLKPSTVMSVIEKRVGLI